MDTKNYVDTLFSEYQENAALEDFKEELCGYMDERIANLVKSGMDEQSAFEKASKDLGDMSAVADEISLKKKQGWTFSPENLGFTAAITVMMSFVLPSAALFIFLMLTEKDRSKPWVVALREKEMRNEQERFASVKEQERFGLFSGAIWIMAIAIFVLLTIILGIKFSWLAIVAALVGQMLLQAAFSKGEK
ncbi:MAG: permease prefix domain 1-containing protein [Gracilibacteraceae bacterium]|jgi:hypothetical protein|nr:permease prefix domain 1-containing protein [Gracilibacteraceae bacterium]